MIDWEKRRKEYAAGKFKRKIVERKAKDLAWDFVTLECGHKVEWPAPMDPSEVKDDYINCRKCATGDPDGPQ